ncbi:winged helix-turn-helix domain-containing protein [Methanolobus sp. WCC4]|uniref:winged helix-turn-helix domain-containing protein n=1 Tax=Methanolobus sp. WCC4 TaxID=3125784 RepID=UPI0030FB0B83
MKSEYSQKKEEWLQRVEKEGRKKANPTEDHKIGLQTMQNPTRRQILKILFDSSVSIEDIGEKLDLNSSMAKFHVEMLENALYVDKVEDSDPLMYQISPRGEAFLENVAGKE